MPARLTNVCGTFRGEIQAREMRWPQHRLKRFRHGDYGSALRTGTVPKLSMIAISFNQTSVGLVNISMDSCEGVGEQGTKIHSIGLRFQYAQSREEFQSTSTMSIHLEYISCHAANLEYLDFASEVPMSILLCMSNPHRFRRLSLNTSR